MPFVGLDPRNLGCFDGLEVPDDVIIPTTTGPSWAHYREHNWVYNKLEIAQTQGLPCSPLGGSLPDRYPVMIKPVYNLFDMGKGTAVARDRSELEACTFPGCFWMEFLEGDHLSHDVILREGKPEHVVTFVGHPLSGRRFDYWETVDTPRAVLDYVHGWLARHLPDFTGCVNLETIGGCIIEVHLRMGDIKRIADRALMQAVVDVYAGKPWRYEGPLPPYYLMVLWGDEGVDYRADPTRIAEIRDRMPLVDIYGTGWRKNNPPGAQRLAQIGCFDFDDGVRARAELAMVFSPTVVPPDKENAAA